MKTLIPRREFLRAASTSGLATMLTSCTALDRVLMGQSADNSDRVVILGAGMAGLRAAYQLRKKGLPYRLFEGSERIGGRAWTLENLTPTGQTGEIGCEWFSQNQTVFWELAKELRLEIIEIPGQRNKLFLEHAGALSQIPKKDLTRLRALARQKEGLPNERGPLLKRMDAWKIGLSNRSPRSVLEWAHVLSEDSGWNDLLDAWAAMQYGAPVEEIRFSAFARDFLFSDHILDAWAGNRFRFRGGSSVLANALLDRVMGPIPGDRLRMSHRLVRVEKLESGFELSFETSEGRRRIKALHVICSLPWAVLRQVEGFEDFSEANIIAAPLVTHQAKAVLSFRDRFWKNRWDQGRVLSSDPFWESSYRPERWVENSWGLLTRTWSGEKAKNASPALVTDFVQHLQSMEKTAQLPLADTHLHTWSRSRWAGARGTLPTLSQKERMFERPQGTWVWAGEHTAGEMAGTWAGALESGAHATSAFLTQKNI